jgi:hypothetical protein
VKFVMSVVWIGLAAGFVWLGVVLGSDVHAHIEPFEPGSPKVEIAGEGFHIELDVAGTPLDEPFAEQRAAMEEYVEAVGQALQERGRRAALLCYAAAAASLLGLLLTWTGARRTPAAG